MAEVQNGRIGGGVLKDNLLRQGVDLNFKNTISDTALLHLDVNNSKISINSEAPVDELTIPTILGTTNLVGTYLNTGNYTIQNSEIINNVDSIFLSSNDYIFATSIATDDLKFDFNTISTTTENQNIEIVPNATGVVNIRSNWNITGSLNATGNITFGGNLTLGDNTQDNVNFEADVNSDIVPDQTTTYSLGSAEKKWNALYSDLLNGQQISLSTIVVNDSSLGLRQGNIFYVSTLGDNTNVGDHQHGAFRTLKHALEVSDASLQGPVTIHIFPGEYEEEFPLVVPPHVTVHGEDIRNVIIKPTVATHDQDAFLIEGDCTIENITIKDFYYNSTSNTGHAFRFTPNGLVSTRSPYIKNITVITKGSVTSADDPRGFDEGDAGKGALINGNELDGDSLEASMLFHSCTFITPGVDAITMTNGVRVEWLNSFTYFANRGLYATQGTEGKIMPDSTIRYGAEMRSIGSANVYGNYGAVADGANTLMYLISHNFSYIGTGKDVSNDGTLVLQNREVQEVNFGKIYYNSTDAFGTYRIGDQFFVDFETGSTSIDATAIDFTGVSSLLINSAGNVTYIDGERIDIGNIRISGNTIENIAEDLIIDPYSDTLDLDSNPGFIISRGAEIDRVSVQGGIRYHTENNLFEGYSTTGHLSFGGIYSSDYETSIDATNDTNEIIIRSQGNEVGRIVDSGLQIHGLSNGDVLIDDNTITTTLSNSDLELRRQEFITITNNNVTTSAISTDYIVLADTTYNSNEGIIYVYDTDGVYLREISNPDVSLGYFGYSLAINGSSLAVGKANGDEVYIFDLTDGSTTLTIADPNTTPSDYFGRSIAYDGTYIVSSSTLYDDTATNQGRVYQFNASTGVLLNTYENPNPQFIDQFGEVLRLNSNYLVIGTPGDFLSGRDNGSVHVYNPTTFALIERINTNFASIYPWQGLSSPSDGYRAGDNLSLNGDLLAISYSNIEGSFGGDNDQGAIIIYDLSSGTRTYEIFNPKGEAYTFLQQGVYVSYDAEDDFLGRDVLILDDNGDLYASATAQGFVYKFTAASDYKEWERTITVDGGYRNSKFAIANDKIINASKLYEEWSEGTPDKGLSVKVDDFILRNNTIINAENNPLVVETTGRGYVKFDTTTGIIFPVGDTASRPSSPEVGNTRWNTDDGIMETYNGTAWQRSAGEGEEVTDEVLKELVDIYTLVLG